MKRSKIIWGVPFLLFLFAFPLPAQEISYDRYAPIGPEGEPMEAASPTAEALKAGASHFLVYPFELLRWPIDQTLLFVEEYHLDDKVDWIYDQMKSHGVTPKIRSLFGGDSLGGGVKIEFVKVAGFQERLPNFAVDGSTLWTLDLITDYKLKIVQDRIAGAGLRTEGIVRYENRGEENFYGIGPNTSLGDGTSYRMERSTFEGALGYSFWTNWDLRTKFSFENVNITNGEDGGRGIIDEIFVTGRRQSIPGLGGDQLLSVGIDLEHDHRDSRELPSQGGYQRLGVTYSKGMDSTSGYFTYRAEAAHFFQVFSDRQAIALRGLVEHHDEAGNREVPFFGMSRLGGYGISPRIGDTHRGFKRDRFYDESLLLANLEYRWTVYNYRDWRVDAVLFWDFGQVFGEWSDFQFDDFRSSFGGGFRVSVEGEMLLTVEMGKSGDGWELYVKTQTPF